MEKNKPNLDLIFNSIWEELNFGATQRKHPFHLCFMATTSSSLTPESRIVILREVVSDKFLLRSNCDLRSSKANEIKENPKTTLLFYDYEKKIQIRIKSKSHIIEHGQQVQSVWDSSQEISKRCYYAAQSPSSILEKPFTNNLLDFDNKDLGINIFGLIVSKAYEIDYLSLNYDGHVRCRFVIENDVVKSSDWIAP